jgi:hypothetical protein
MNEHPGIEPPVRETEVSVQCRCLLVDKGRRDRCAQQVSNPDSPVCDDCDFHGHQSMSEFRMVPL